MRDGDFEDLARQLEQQADPMTTDEAVEALRELARQFALVRLALMRMAQLERRLARVEATAVIAVCLSVAALFAALS